ncbi:MAG: YigZ family protein, partial [Clostridia bacterium]
TLEVLRRENVTNVLCVVTRYFGGVLLGVGGLTRAYARSAKIALDAAGISRMRLWCSLTIDTPYNMQEGVRQKAVALNGIIENTDFGARVVYSVFVPAEETDAFIANIIDFTAGAVTPIKAGEKYMGVPV